MIFLFEINDDYVDDLHNFRASINFAAGLEKDLEL